MTDPIDLAVARATMPKPRQGGTINLPSGEIAMIDLPNPFTALDCLALVAAISAGFIQATPQKQEPASRILVPHH